MNHSGDAAEQIVRMSLEGVEVAARITGSAAKEITLLLLAAVKSPEKNPSSKLKLKGKERLNTMLKSGKPLEIFSVKESDLKKFTQGAKEYGIVYCVLRNTKNSPDGLCDIMVKADDAPKISRLIERFQFATVDRASIESEIVVERAEKTADTEPVKAEKEATDSPPFARSSPTSLPSEITSDSGKNSERAISSKPSVKKEMREIAAARKSKDIPATTHKQPQRGKSNKMRGSR